MSRPTRSAGPDADGPRANGVQGDRGLMSRIREEDGEALDLLIRRYWEPLVQYAVGFLGTVDAAEDVVQETFVRVWKSRKDWSPRGSVRAYLFTITRNLCHHERDRRKVRADWTARQPREPALSPSPHAVVAGRELHRTLDRAVRELPPRRREAFTLVCLQGLSYREAAQAMGVAVPTVANQLSAALSALRHAMEPLVERES